MIEHQPWKGKNYEQADARILLVGHSHYSDEPDHEGLTIQTAEHAAAGDMNWSPFFARPHRWLGDSTSQRDFWDSIAFINFIPDVIGGSAKRYGRGTPDQHERGFERLVRVITEMKPTHVFVTTPKPEAGKQPEYRISSLPGASEGEPIRVDGGSRYRTLHMQAGHGPVKIALLPHPQSARKADMQQVFSTMLAGAARA